MLGMPLSKVGRVGADINASEWLGLIKGRTIRVVPREFS